MARVYALDIENVKAEKKEEKIVLPKRRLSTRKQNHVKCTFFLITKGSSILDRTLSVMLGGLPARKAYLSIF